MLAMQLMTESIKCFNWLIGLKRRMTGKFEYVCGASYIEIVQYKTKKDVENKLISIDPRHQPERYYTATSLTASIKYATNFLVFNSF